MFVNRFALVLIVFLCKICKPFSIDDLRESFGDKTCIEGSLSSLPKSMGDTFFLKESKETENFVANISSKNVEKSLMSRVHELAQFNEIKYHYELQNEEGPPHSKTFTVQLTLGDERYKGTGTSLKRAQQIAAAVAIENTEYEQPPITTKESGNTLTPTVLLNNFAAKLGMSVKYFLITNEIEKALSSNDMIDERPKKSYLQKLNDSVYSEDSIHIRKDESNLKGPFKVKVNVDDQTFIGEAHTIKSARHEAAMKALKGLKEIVRDQNSHCLKEGFEIECQQAKESLKSPISLVYEAAQKRNLDISFEIIDESGPSHKKDFTTECKLGQLSTTGRGNSKKVSKRIAAELMLERLPELPEVSIEKEYKNVASKDKKRKKKNKLIKSTFDKVEMLFDSVVDFGAEVFKKISTEEEPLHSKKPKGNPKTSASEDVLKISNILNIESQFTDFSEGDNHYSILHLDLKPSFICFGEGISQKVSRNKASKGAINLLYKLGSLDSILKTVERNDITLDEKEEINRIIFYIDRKQQR